MKKFALVAISASMTLCQVTNMVLPTSTNSLGGLAVSQFSKYEGLISYPSDKTPPIYEPVKYNIDLGINWEISNKTNPRAGVAYEHRFLPNSSFGITSYESFSQIDSTIKTPNYVGAVYIPKTHYKEIKHGININSSSSKNHSVTIRSDGVLAGNITVSSDDKVKSFLQLSMSIDKIDNTKPRTISIRNHTDKRFIYSTATLGHQAYTFFEDNWKVKADGSMTETDYINRIDISATDLNNVTLNFRSQTNLINFAPNSKGGETFKITTERIQPNPDGFESAIIVTTDNPDFVLGSTDFWNGIMLINAKQGGTYNNMTGRVIIQSYKDITINDSNIAVLNDMSEEGITFNINRPNLDSVHLYTINPSKNTLIRTKYKQLKITDVVKPSEGKKFKSLRFENTKEFSQDLKASIIITNIDSDVLKGDVSFYGYDHLYIYNVVGDDAFNPNNKIRVMLYVDSLTGNLQNKYDFVAITPNSSTNGVLNFQEEVYYKPQLIDLYISNTLIQNVLL